MGWILIFIGAVLLTFAIYRLYNEISSSGEEKIDENRNINLSRNRKKYRQVDDDLLETIRNKIINFEREMDFNYQQLKKVNDKMSLLLEKVYRKEEEINNTLKEVSLDIDKNKINLNLEENIPEDNFSDILSNRINEKDMVPEKYLEIFELYKSGMTADEIAEEMDIGVGETRLIFKLYGKEVKNV